MKVEQSKSLARESHEMILKEKITLEFKNLLEIFLFIMIMKKISSDNKWHQ
jgi:hypothetical protein